MVPYTPGPPPLHPPPPQPPPRSYSSYELLLPPRSARAGARCGPTADTGAAGRARPARCGPTLRGGGSRDERAKGPAGGGSRWGVSGGVSGGGGRWRPGIVNVQTLLRHMFLHGICNELTRAREGRAGGREVGGAGGRGVRGVEGAHRPLARASLRRGVPASAIARGPVPGRLGRTGVRADADQPARPAQLRGSEGGRGSRVPVQVGGGCGTTGGRVHILLSWWEGGGVGKGLGRGRDLGRSRGGGG